MNKGNELDIPASFNFADLKLRRNPATGGLNFEVRPILEVLRHNGISVAHLQGHYFFPAMCGEALRACYRVHLARGGEKNAVLEEYEPKKR